MQQIIKNLRFTWFGTIIIIFILALISNYFHVKNIHIFNISKIPMILNYVVILFLIISIPVTHYIYGVFLKKGKNEIDNDIKIAIYRKFFIIKFVLCWLAALLNIVVLYIKYERQFLYMVFIVVIFLFFNIPSVKKFKQDFEIE